MAIEELVYSAVALMAALFIAVRLYWSFKIAAYEDNDDSQSFDHKDWIASMVALISCGVFFGLVFF